MIKRNYLILACLLIVSVTLLAQPFGVGHTTATFFDSSRSRNVPTEIYYPADSPGESVPVALGNFPVIVFGHGFLMSWEAYQNFWSALVPDGYVICFPTTETGFSPSHENFGADIKFVAAQMQIENGSSSSIFFDKLSEKTALMGHSMGGGASFLAAKDNPAIHTLINFAAAETTPSAIAAAASVAAPTLMFSGSDDCVTPPAEHQIPMYNSLAADCKTHISIIDGAHCYFADFNFFCNLGESLCNPSPAITREAQQLATFDFLSLWLDYSLLDNLTAFAVFNDSLQSSTRITFEQMCNTIGIAEISTDRGIKIFPNPAVDKVNFVVSEENIGGLMMICNMMGERVYQQQILKSEFQMDVSGFTSGLYWVVYFKNESAYTGKFFKTGVR
jgi:pimeloyl-ACP methyl ester carboxylesterase